MQNPTTLPDPGWQGDPDRGASLGRPSGTLKASDMPPHSIKIELVSIDSGGYDPGGSYWGIGKPLWCAYGETEEGEYREYVRAKSRWSAAAKLELSDFDMATPKTEDFAKEILQGLITCAVWAECSEYDEDDEEYEPGDVLRHMDVDDFSPSAVQFLRDYCVRFVKAFPEFCENPDLYRIRQWNSEEGTLLEYVGHDLWLTTCGHGSGFRDGNWERRVGEKLSEWCRKQGEIDLYLGDDNLIYVFGKENYGKNHENHT